MITVIDLNHSINPYSLLSQDLIDSIEDSIKAKKRVLVFVNRRGESNALICKDCSFHAKCKDCDLSLNVHKYPTSVLLCHQCNKSEHIPELCPVCKGSNLLPIGVGIQKIFDNLSKIFASYKITRLDSDKINKEGIIFDDIIDSDIIVSTEIGNTLSIDNLGLVVFPLFESELSVGEYNIEEKIFTNVFFNSKRGANVLIQTYVPKNDLLRSITSGNYKDFLFYTLSERKKFFYPPYCDFLNISIKGNSKERITDIFAKFVNKLSILNEDNKIIINHDKDNFIKKRGEFYLNILLRGENLESFLEPMRLEIIRNREIDIEWK